MRKIPTVFVRDPQDMSRVTAEVNPECQWVLDGEGVATRKYDGTCVQLAGGRWWARREVKPGKTPPDGWLHVDTDENTGKRMGWEPIEQSPFAKFHAEALASHVSGLPPSTGTYELIGPKINGNPEDVHRHILIRHEHAETFGTTGIPRIHDDLRALVLALAKTGWEGIVFHHPDGRMAKLKARDFPTTGKSGASA